MCIYSMYINDIWSLLGPDNYNTLPSGIVFTDTSPIIYRNEVWSVDLYFGLIYTSTTVIPIIIMCARFVPDSLQYGLLDDLTINGATSVNENSTATYTATASWSDGTTSTVMPTWSENSAYATISSDGVLTTIPVSGNQVVTITASYEAAGVAKSSTYSVTIVDSVELVTYPYIPGSYNYYLPYFKSGDGNWTGLGLANSSLAEISH